MSLSEKSAEAPMELDLLPLIDRLPACSSGLAYLYWCLDHLVEALGLDDAVLTMEHPALGLQIFRAKKRPAAEEVEGERVDKPGLYLFPDPLNDEHKRAVAQLCDVALTIELARHDASNDALTGLLNRRSFSEAINGFRAHSERHGMGFCLALLDVDGLKVINDTMGHFEGDRLLRITGSELRRCLRAGDVAARIGGDEFAVLLANGTAEAADRLKGRLQESVSRALNRPMAFSVGAAVAPTESLNADELFRLADGRLYEDKRRR